MLCYFYPRHKITQTLLLQNRAKLDIHDHLVGVTIFFGFPSGLGFGHGHYKGKRYCLLTIAQCSGKPLFFPVPILTNFWPPRFFFVKTQQIRNKPSNFTNFLLYNQMILHKRDGNQSSGSTKSLHWLISFAACSLISGQHGKLNNFCSNMLKIMFFCTFRLYHEN